MPASARTSTTSRLVPLAIAIVAMALYALAAYFLKPYNDLQPLTSGAVTEAESQALDMVKELNTYLVSTVTLLLGGLGWYLTQYQPPQSALARTAFFTAVGFVALALVYAGLTNVELTGELAQNSLALKPGNSLTLFYLEREIWTCGIAAVLILIVFSDAVTRGKL